jgi:hypothetical protein
MKKNILFFCMLFCSILAVAQSTTKTMKRLPDTGEITSYTNTFGEDADFIIYPPFFFINGNGTVTDTVTGLMWQQVDGGEMTIENAINYCDSLSLGGYTDWRLPTAHEAFSIQNMQYTNPSLNTSVFSITGAEYWWSSNKQANDANKVWCTNAGGGIGNHPKTETISAGGTKKFHVRAVRGIFMPEPIANHFTDNGNGTITDNVTNLVWQKIHSTDSLSWEQSLTYADTTTIGGYTDWRLPNIKELQSINDENLINPSVNNTFFSNVGVNKFWSSTSLPNQTTKAWYLSTQFGITTYDAKTVKHYIYCVRGDQTTILPLQLINFSAQQNEQKVILNWQTENEVNTKEFLIETSEDGKIFASKNTIAALCDGNHFYSFTLLESNAKYVRLKIVDRDGKYCYSRVIKIAATNQKGIIINHSINSNVLQVNVNSILYNNTPVYIYDANGNLLKQFIIHQGLQTIDISSLRCNVIYIKTQTGVIKTLIKY